MLIRSLLHSIILSLQNASFCLYSLHFEYFECIKKCVLFSGPKRQWHHESTLVSKLTEKKNTKHRFRKTLAKWPPRPFATSKIPNSFEFSWNWIRIGNSSLMAQHLLDYIVGFVHSDFVTSSDFFEFLHIFIQSIHAENRI